MSKSKKFLVGLVRFGFVVSLLVVIAKIVDFFSNEADDNQGY